MICVYYCCLVVLVVFDWTLILPEAISIEAVFFFNKWFSNKSYLFLYHSLTFLISLWFILGESFLAFAAWLDSLERNTQNPLTHSVIWLTRQLVLSLVLDNNNLLLFSCFFSSDDERLKGEKRTFLSFNSSRKGVWRTKSRSDLHSPLSLFLSFLTSLHSWKGFMMMNRDREEKVCKKHEGVSNQGVVTKK